MFRNFKEYQELQKLYEEKVSKTEDIKEFKSKFSKPQQPVKSPMEAGMGPGAAKAREMAKARIAAKKAASQPKSTPSVDSFKQGMNTPLNVSATKKPEVKVETKPTETKPTETKPAPVTKTRPTYQDNRNRQNRLRQQQNKGRVERQFGFLKPKPIERKPGQTSVRSRGGGVKGKVQTQSNTGTEKIIPKPNTGTDTETKTNKIIPKPNTGTDTETKTNKITPKPNTGTDTETKTNKITPKPNTGTANTGTDTEKKTSTSSLSASDRIKAFRDRKRNLQTRAKYGSNATIETQDGKSFKPGDPGYEEQLKKAKETVRKSMKEAYASIYNPPAEQENIDEGVKREVAKKVGQAVKKKVGKLIRQGVREKGALPGGPQKPKKGFYNVKAGPNSQYDYSGTGIKKVRPEGGGSRRVKATYGKKPEKTFMQSQKDKLEAQRQGVSVKELDASRKAETAAAKDAVAKAEAPRSGVDLRKGKKATKRTSFQDKDFKPKYENYEPYDIVLEYLLSTQQVATIEEANYVMTEMDAETIQGIVEEQKKNFDEGLASMALKTGLAVGGAVLAKKGLDKTKKSFDNYLNKQRDKGIGGNTRPGSDKMYYGDKKEK